MLKKTDFCALILIRVKSAYNFRVVFRYVIMHLDQLQGVQYYFPGNKNVCARGEQKVPRGGCW